MIEKVKLGDIASVITKGTTPTSIGYGFIENGINFIKIESITEEGCFVKEKFAHISEECNSRLKRSQIEENDILFSIAGAIGRVAVVNSTVLPANTNQALAIIRVDNRYDKEFLAFLLRSSFIQKQYNKKKQGVAQINLSLKDIAELEIPIISIKKQLVIKENLNDIINIISLKKKQLKELNELIKSQFVEMFENKSFEKTTIGKCAKFQGGYAFKSKDFVENGVKLVQISNVNKDTLDWIEINRVPDNFREKYKEYSLVENDVVMAMTRPIIKSLNEVKIAIVTREDLPCLLNQRVGRFIVNEKLNKEYLRYCCKSDKFKNYVEKMSGNSLQPNISSKQVENYEINLPPIELQNKFAEFVKQVDKQKFEIQKSIEEMQLLQESLMDKYFGEMEC